MTAVLYQPTGEAEAVTPTHGDEFELDQLQKAVGGYIELVYLPDDMVMVVNEEGLLEGLPFNENASIIAGRPLVGPVLLCPQSMVS